jgi:glycosyltransferase involved in cell wall biosynthesis
VERHGELGRLKTISKIIVKLSIITVNLNNHSGLRKTIDSVVNQTYADYEYIIIDGSSSDRSLEVIKEYLDKIDYWVSESDKGIYNAMNKGIKKAKGDYCYFLNSGDFLYSNDTLEKVFNLCDESDIIYGDILVTSSQNSWVLKHPPDLSFLYFYTREICHQAAFIKRCLFDENGFYNESLKVVSDWEFFLKTIILSVSKYKHVNLIISVYTTGGFGYQNPQLYLAERQQVLEVNFPKLILKDYEVYKSNYEDNQSLVYIKKHKLSYFIFKVLRKTTLLFDLFFKSK